MPFNSLCPNPVLLAPMVGLTHYAVRNSVAGFLPAGQKAIWPTEMLNSRRIPHQRRDEFPETLFLDRANGLCPQLLANEESFIRQSVPKLEDWGAVAIDINMGCPVQKALKHNYGVALMGDPAYAAEVVRITVAHAKVPVSVKLRAGSENQGFDDLLRFISGLYEAGASWITLHPRTAEKKRKGDADWNLIRRLKQIFREEGKNRIIIGNGDVQCHEDILRMFEETECDRVMVGRAMIVKPWLIRNEVEPDPWTQGDLYGRFFKSVLRECREHYALEAGLRRLRFLIVQGKPWVEYGETLYGRMMAARSYEDVDLALEKFFSQKQRIIRRTALRT